MPVVKNQQNGTMRWTFAPAFAVPTSHRRQHANRCRRQKTCGGPPALHSPRRPSSSPRSPPGPEGIHRASPIQSRGVLKGENKERKVFLCTVFPKRPRVAHMFNHGWWRLVVGGWWRLAVGNWQLAVGGGWWWLAAVGGWWRLAVVGGWLLVAAGGWRRLLVGGWWRLVVGAGWWLAVGGPLGRSLRAVLNKKQKKI